MSRDIAQGFDGSTAEVPSMTKQRFADGRGGARTTAPVADRTGSAKILLRRRIELVNEMARLDQQMEKAEEAMELAQAAYEAAKRAFEQKRDELFGLLKQEKGGPPGPIRTRRRKAKGALGLPPGRTSRRKS
jgi:multidrug resistance efflux pump